jgi:AraC-like DNA-binding protein
LILKEFRNQEAGCVSLYLQVVWHAGGNWYIISSNPLYRMPLFMEFHKASRLSMADLRKKVGAANEMLQRYSVRYHQFWLNEEGGVVFCLMEGPSLRICEAVHLTINGDISFSITPVKAGLELSFARPASIDAEVPPNGYALDRGFILLACIDPTAHAAPLKKLIRNFIISSAGVEISQDNPHQIAAYFSASNACISCATTLQHSLLTEQELTRFRISVATTAPGQNKAGENLLSRAHAFSRIAADANLVVCGLLKDISSVSSQPNERLKVLTLSDEHFLFSLLQIIESHMSDDAFNVDVLARKAGFSRPQLYRKVHSLTGRAPNIFVRDIRMEKALELLRLRDRNICEVALEVGYTNPSYFARTFAERYGCTPSGFLVSEVE